MTALVDDLGVWEQLGTITLTNDWQTFPIQASSGFNTFRAHWAGDLSDVKSLVYLRSVYILLGNPTVGKRWQKLYAKPEREIIEIPLAQEFALQNLGRYFEVIKKYKFRQLGYTVTDSEYSLTLEEFIPYPETVEVMQNKPAIKQAVTEVLAENNLIPSLPPSTPPPAPPV